MSDDREALLAGLEQVVEEALRWFEGPGRNAPVKVGWWGPREVLCHCLFWHQVTVEGMESVARGGPPRHLDAPVDQLNARAVAEREGRDMDSLVEEARRLQEALARAVRSLPDINTVVLVRADGSTHTARQRLEVITGHWRDHLQEMQERASPPA